jgi:ribosome maturation factor RimP
MMTTMRLPQQRDKESRPRHISNCNTTISNTVLVAVCILLIGIDRGVSFRSLNQQYHRYQEAPCPSSSTSAASSSFSALFSTTSNNNIKRRSPSRVTDPSGSTPPLEEIEYPQVKMEDLPEMQYDKYVPPIPHQPWRRGEMVGCNDPIDSEWRKEAERRIKLAVQMVGATYIDVTWYLTFVVVTVGDIQSMPQDCYPPSGPFVRWNHIQEDNENIFIDPDDPNPEPIWGIDELNKVMYERDENIDLENDIKSKTYARPDKEELREKKVAAIAAAASEGGKSADHDGDKDDEAKAIIADYDDIGLDPSELDEPSLYVNQEFREDERLRLYLQKQVDADTMPKVETMATLRETLTNKEALSAIGGAIYDALQEVEDELQILARHEVILSSEGHGNVIETQQRFDSKRGCKVAVHTQDPWQSNRILKGILLDRNALDVYIKKQGRMVTIPNNFVKYVELVDPADHEPNPDYLNMVFENNMQHRNDAESDYLAASSEEEMDEDDEEEEEDEYGDDDEVEDIYEDDE